MSKDDAPKVLKITSISGSLYQEIRTNYFDSVKAGIRDSRCRSAIPSYILAVAMWEAYLYEKILTKEIIFRQKNSAFDLETKSNLENLSIEKKTIEVPKLLLGKTFSRDKQPYQDFKSLVAIRNQLVHFKYEPKDLIKPVKDLCQRGIFIESEIIKSSKGDFTNNFSWVEAIQTIKGIQWAGNLVIDMIEQIFNFVPEVERKSMSSYTSQFIKLPNPETVKFGFIQ